MNTRNLIKLGALAQKKFEMKDNFRIMEVPSDSSNIIQVAVPYDRTSQPREEALEFIDRVVLEKFASDDNFEFIRAGYSVKANVLVIKELEKS